MPIAAIIIMALLTKFWWLLILIALSIVIIPIVNTIEKRKESTEITKVSTKKEMQKVRLDMSSTDIGYINKNNQKNIGRTDNPGNDHQKWYYICIVVMYTIQMVLIYGRENALSVKVAKVTN